jgi:beta-aspartyl-peptidase (threonine type)
MDGRNLQAGSVAGVRKIARPIDLARLVMDKSDHVLLGSEGAERFAEAHGMKLVNEDYFFTERRWNQLQTQLKKEGTSKAILDHDGKHGTVGAVALDRQGNLAAATSSGGMTNKRFGRIGDSSLVGAGTYANNKTCAASTTGVGEYFMRAVTAFDLSALMEYKSLPLTVAADKVIEKMSALGGDGGLIAIDAEGNIAMPFCSLGMYRGFMKSDGSHDIKIWKDR